MQKFLPLSKPTISNETIEEVINVLKSGWIATGPLSQKFEEKLSEYFEGRQALCVTSATAGLKVALMAIGVKAGDEVITTSLTFASTANVIAMLGAKPIFVDIERDSFNIDPNKIAEACTEKTKAIMPVHYAGLPVDLDPIYEIAKAKNLRIIEDAAHAMGSEYKKRKIGTFGDIQVFSFHPIKNMTSGEGGCIVFDKSLTKEKKFIELQRFHGIDRSIWDRFSKNASCYYDVVMPGEKSNMSDLQAAIGIHQLQELEQMNERRRFLAARYRKAFAELSEKISMQAEPEYEFIHSGHLFPICVKDETKRDDFMAFLKENSIGTTPYYMPLHLFSYYKNTFGYNSGMLEHTEYVGKRIVCIPLYTALQEVEQDYIISTIKKFFA
ncbi:MAG: DegT/DnrJ/EryC1/StrS family aminotransferase [Alphaproteobacteria bacterium]|nr:DegT/DnrJ/EryC1/StrS family aminotransferase [Alphaproteobacteria bacterium]